VPVAINRRPWVHTRSTDGWLPPGRGLTGRCRRGSPPVRNLTESRQRAGGYKGSLPRTRIDDDHKAT